ncbi:immunoglobulin domain-containing protein [Roseibacillus persicicus]|uniref:immunoglobulin domain-containing protein n=1 Tax=Roseibacillus persicicus TaxID=454148 RepID=UPI00398AFCD2
MKFFDATILAALLGSQALQGQIISQDSFSAYAAGALSNQDPAVTGYLFSWSQAAFGTDGPGISLGSLTYSDVAYATGGGNKVAANVDTAGIQAANSGRVARELDLPLIADDTTTGTLYLSWLFQTGNEGAAPQADVYQTLSLHYLDGTDGNRTFDAGIASGDFGTPNFAYRVNNNAGLGGILNIAVDDQVHLFVAKFELNDTAASDVVTVWIDPTLGGGDPAGGVSISGIDLQFDRLAFSDYASNSSAWDEVRWGTTFDSVTVETVFPSIPEFVDEPADFFGFVGDTISFSAGVIADPAPTYVWEYFDDESGEWSVIGGETGETLQIPNATYANNGFYRVTATNENGSITSSGDTFASLSYPDPLILQQPASAVESLGSTVELSVVATGLGNLSYQWFHDLEPIAGATSATYTIASLSPSDVGEYDVKVVDDAAEEEGESGTSIFSDSAFVGISDLTITSSATAPSIDSADQFYLPGAVDDVDNIGGEGAENSGANDGSTYVAADRTSQGMTFTTGDDPLGYSLSSITIQHVLWETFLGNGTFYTVADRDTFEFQFGSLVDEVKTVIYDTDGAVYTGNELAGFGDSGTGTFLTFNLSSAEIGTLSPNTTYYFEIASESGDPFMELNGTSTDGYAGGKAFQGSAAATIDETYLALEGDRAFHADLTGLTPGQDFASWISGFPGVGTLDDPSDDPDGDGVPNAVENLFGTDPTVRSEGLQVIVGNGTAFSFQHPRSNEPATDLVLSYVWSPDLQNWYDNGVAAEGSTVTFEASPNFPIAGTSSVSVSVAGDVQTKLFFAVQATP